MGEAAGNFFRSEGLDGTLPAFAVDNGGARFLSGDDSDDEDLERFWFAAAFRSLDGSGETTATFLTATGEGDRLRLLSAIGEVIFFLGGGGDGL